MNGEVEDYTNAFLISLGVVVFMCLCIFTAYYGLLATIFWSLMVKCGLDWWEDHLVSRQEQHNETKNT